jgi:hypothetical protein
MDKTKLFFDVSKENEDLFLNKWGSLGFLDNIYSYEIKKNLSCMYEMCSQIIIKDLNVSNETKNLMYPILCRVFMKVESGDLPKTFSFTYETMSKLITFVDKIYENFKSHFEIINFDLEAEICAYISDIIYINERNKLPF